MTKYLIENCDINTFPAVWRAIEKAPEGVTKVHLLMHKLPSDVRGVYARYHLEAPDKGKYMNIRFHDNSIIIETNCSESSMSKLLYTLPNFTIGNLKTIDDTVTAEP